MNERDFQAWADKIDNRPSYATRTAGRINYMRFAPEKRSMPAWKRSAVRRQYELRLMRVRMEMEELL